MARESLQAGACAVRICGVENIRKTREINPSGIIIDITKSNYNDCSVLITPDINDISSIILTGADIVALDMTKRKRPHGISSLDLYFEARREYPNKIFMADISDREECSAAYMTSSMLGYFFLRGHYKKTKKVVDAKPIYKYSRLVFIVLLTLTLFYSLDVMLVKHYFDSLQAGYYAAFAILGRIAFFVKF